MIRSLRSLRSHVVVLAIVFSAPGSSLFAVGEGRVLGTVVDTSLAPVAGAKIVVTREGTAIRQEKVSSEKGTFSLLILDATVKYHIHIEKDHFLPLDETLVPVAGDTVRITFTLRQYPAS